LFIITIIDANLVLISVHYVIFYTILLLYLYFSNYIPHHVSKGCNLWASFSSN